jgi:uroporphyrinogen decarboxylase
MHGVRSAKNQIRKRKEDICIMMTGKEVIRKAIEFDKPDRLPVQFDLFKHNDSHIVYSTLHSGGNLIGESTDVWGCVWTQTKVHNMGQVTGHPLVSYDMLDKHIFPDYTDPMWFEDSEEGFSGSNDKYTLVMLYHLLFERMHMLRGFENLLMDIYLEPEWTACLANKVADCQIALIENLAYRFPGRIDGIRFTDDWGTELNTFISVEMFKKFFMPCYKRIFKACKKAGWHIWLHSCGRINDFILPLIECGVDVFNLQQPRTLGIEDFGKNFAGKACFSSLCDIQLTLPTASVQEINDEAALLLNNWATEDGGFILTDYNDNDAIGVSVENKRAMYDAFLKLDPYK